MLVSLDVDFQQVDMPNTAFAAKIVQTNGLHAFRSWLAGFPANIVHPPVCSRLAAVTAQYRLSAAPHHRDLMDDEVIKMIEPRGLSQSGCDLWRRLERTDDGVRLAGQGCQAINPGVCSNIKDNFGFLCGSGPITKDLLFKEIGTKEVALPLQHFGQIARHLQSAVAQMRQTRCASVAGCGTPQPID